jgi:hypothetical protein
VIVEPWPFGYPKRVKANEGADRTELITTRDQRVRGVGTTGKETDSMLWLILGIVLLCIAIAGGAIVHPIIFVLALIALWLFFTGWRGRRATY